MGNCVRFMKDIGNGALKTRNGLTDLIRYEYLYSDNTYSGLFSTLDEIVKNKEKFINNVKIKINNFKPKHEPYQIIIKEQDRYPGVLKTRRCISGLVRDNSIIHVVWFDDGDIPMEESLMNILPEINWDESKEI